MRSLASSFDRFWFRAVPPTSLAVLRVVVGLYALWHVGTRYDLLRNLARTSIGLFQPVGLARLLEAPLPPAVFDGILHITLILGLLFVLGVRHRLVGPLFAVMLLGVLSYRNSWSMIFHSENLLALHVLVLGFTPSACAISFDAWVERRGGGLRLARLGAWNPPGGAAGGAFGWPLRLIGCVTLTAYFLAGVAKIAGPLGLSWASGQAMWNQVAVDALRKELLSSGASPVFVALQDQLWLFGLIGAISLALELGAPLVATSHRWALGWALGVYGMHWGILLMMGITFRYQLTGVAFLSFLLSYLTFSRHTADSGPRRGEAYIVNEHPHPELGTHG